MAFSTVTWANRNIPTLAKFNQMGANTSHLLVEMEAITIATNGLMTGIQPYSTTYDLVVKVDSLIVGYVAAPFNVPAAEYVLANKSIAALEVGQHTLYLNSRAFKFWRPAGVDYLTAWLQLRVFDLYSPVEVQLYCGTVMIHRTPLAI